MCMHVCTYVWVAEILLSFLMDVTKYPDRNKLIKEEFILTHALKEQLWWWKSQDGRKVKMVEYEAMGHVMSTLRK